MHQPFTRLLKPIAFACVSVSSCFLLSACLSTDSIDAPIADISFQTYQQQTIATLRERRDFQLLDTESELAWNAPKQWLPRQTDESAKPQRGILFVHGLGDSPWSFHDIGPQLAEQGFLVRTVLLPGHGTSPYDMLEVTAADWRKVVFEQAQRLQNDVAGEVYLGGFSTGANLALEYAYQDSAIDGLVLYSPGFKSVPFDWLAPIAANFMSWFVDPEEDDSLQTPLRYMNMPVNGFAQYYYTSSKARELLQQPYEKPVFMVVAEHDSVLDTDYLLETFQTRFTHPQSRLVWYGALPEHVMPSERLLVQTDYLPDERISQFSHMGMLFTPNNPLYGRSGSQRICMNSRDRSNLEACANADDVWFSAWGYEEEGKLHARLTFNPYFDWQNEVMFSVLTYAASYRFKKLSEL